MVTLALYRLHATGRVRRALNTLALEVRTLVAALLQPNRIISDVKAMHALHREAARVEESQPVRALALRHRAALLPR